MYVKFLDSIGVATSKLTCLNPSDEYIKSFWKRFDEKPFEHGCAALAGRELLSSIRSKYISDALSITYSVDNIVFWEAHTEDEEAHFWRMWKPLVKMNGDDNQLVDVAKNEISRHVKYWDDLLEFISLNAA
jgi:hypothetical protein